MGSQEQGDRGVEEKQREKGEGREERMRTEKNRRFCGEMRGRQKGPRDHPVTR